MARVLPLVAYVAIMWAVHMSGTAMILGSKGVIPHEGNLFTDIIAGALLHGGEDHITSNLKALIPLLIGLAIIDHKPWLTLIILIVGAGIMVWILAPLGDGEQYGASDVLFGLVGFLAVYGIRSREMIPMVVAAAALFYFGLETWHAIRPGEGGASWEGHLGGVIVGIVWGFMAPMERR